MCEQEVGSKVPLLPSFGLWDLSCGSLKASSTCSGLALAVLVLKVLVCAKKEPLLFRDCDGAFSEKQVSWKSLQQKVLYLDSL